MIRLGAAGALHAIPIRRRMASARGPDLETEMVSEGDGAD
jgi:hypothetical protein